LTGEARRNRVSHPAIQLRKAEPDEVADVHAEHGRRREESVLDSLPGDLTAIVVPLDIADRSPAKEVLRPKCAATGPGK
jgi:hypothetical protein